MIVRQESHTLVEYRTISLTKFNVNLLASIPKCLPNNSFYEDPKRKEGTSV